MENVTDRARPALRFGKLFALAGCVVVCRLAMAEASLEARFAEPPESSRLQTWWHWCGDNVTEKGIAADLVAMREMDVGTAHVFSPAMMRPIPGYHAKLLTDEWKRLFAFAVAEAKKNGIRLGFHNCPGWSSSGGPWIRPEDSMKVVVCSAVDVRAGTGKVRVPQPEAKHGFYRDIALVAFPVADEPARVRVTGDFRDDFTAFAAGEKPVRLPLLRGKSSPAAVTLEYAAPFRPSTLSIQFADSRVVLTGVVEASADGKSWRQLRTFGFHFHSDIGDAKYLAVDCPQPSRFFRVTFRPGDIPEWMGGKSFDTRLKALALTAVPMVPDLGLRNSSTIAIGYRPAANPGQPGIAKSAFVDLTAHLAADGWLTLPPSTLNSRPSTCHRILRIGYTTSGKTCAPATLPGLECDKLSKRGLDAHWPHLPRTVFDTPGAKGTVAISLIDSYEVGGQNWTEDLPAEFARRRGYDLMPYLPAVVGYTVGTAGETAKFLFDLQRTVADLFAENYYDYFAELCHREGILTATEAYGGPFDSLRCFRTADVPTGEFWLGASPCGSPRVAASAGHLNGRAQVGAEAFTTEAMPGRWQVTPHQLRVSGDRGWLEGISQLVYHSYLSQPFMNVKPGLSLGRHGSQLNRNTTWWKDGKGWSRYVRRGQFLLQAGKSKVDALVLAGDSKPNGYQRPNAFVKAGFNFDFCGRDDLLRLEVRGGRVNMPGQEPYEMVALGVDRYLTIPVLEKVKALLAAGVRVAGVRPLGSPSLADDPAAWQTLADEIWGGKWPTLAATDDVLKAAAAFGLKPPADSRGRLGALRRRIEGRDFYFLLNDRDEPFEGNVTFAAAGAPSAWDAKTGEIRPLPRYRAEPGRVTTRFALPPHGSLFVGFAPATDDAALAEAPDDKPRYEPVEILSASYFAADDASLKADVTENVRRLVAAGQLEFAVGNKTLGVRDPASNHYKVLKVAFAAGGKPHEKLYREHTMASLAVPVKATAKPEKVLADISSGWRITSFDGVNAPAAPIELAKLASWGDSADPKLRYFSGYAVYEKEIDLPKADSVTLDLGEVHDIANVSVNGKFLACLWEPPYRMRLSRNCLDASTSQLSLRIEVVNTWPNRMIGDAIARQRGAAEPKKGAYPEWVLADRPDSGTGIFTWSNFDYGWTAADKPLPAGLLGPVRLLPCD